MRHTGLVAPRHVGSSWTRVSCIGRRILNHWTTVKPPYIPLLTPCPMLFMLLPLSVTSVEEGDRWVGCRGGDRKRNKRKGAGSLTAVRHWCFKLFSMDKTLTWNTVKGHPRVSRGKPSSRSLCCPPVLPWMQAMDLTSPSHSQRNSMNIQAVVPLQSQDGLTNPTGGDEPHAPPCPALLPSLCLTDCSKLAQEALPHSSMPLHGCAIIYLTNTPLLSF